MNPLSGYIELELAGEVLPFKFGTNAWALFCDKYKIDFYQITDTGVFGKVVDGKEISPNLFALRDIVYFAYVSAVRAKEERPKFNIEKFSELLDETPGVMVQLKDALIASKIMGFTLKNVAEEGKETNFPKA